MIDKVAKNATTTITINSVVKTYLSGVVLLNRLEFKELTLRDVKSVYNSIGFNIIFDKWIF